MTAKKLDKFMTVLFISVAFIITMILLGLISFVLFKGLKGISWDFLTAPPENLSAGGGIGPQLFNSFYLLLLTMIFTLPLGIGGGIYMAEYAKPNVFSKVAGIIIEVLSSLPSIVVGLFGLLFFVQRLGLGFSILSAALTLMIFNLPLMVRITEQALRTVPLELKEGGFAMGLSHWAVIIHVMLPTALPGIITGTILSAGRVFGEAAALMYTAGMTTPPLDFSTWIPFEINSPLNPFRPAETLAVHIWKINSEGLAPDAGQIVASASAVLIGFVAIFNIFSRWLGKFAYKKYTAQ